MVRGHPLLVGDDANSHHTLWGSTDTNSRGNDLLEYLITSDLDIFNTGNIPSYHNSVREEVIYRHHTLHREFQKQDKEVESLG